MSRLSTILIIILVSFLATNVAVAKSFDQWLSEFKNKAAREGVSPSTISKALNGLSPNERVIELDRNQPSKKWTFVKYQSQIVSRDRIQKGRRLYRDNYTLLKQIESEYGVPAQVVVALWGIESNFGQNMGGFDVIRSLATLAWEGRREKLFTDELMNALKIIDQGHVTHENMKGSWAGAMGQCQFMPSSFNRLARDGNGDGRKDIWRTKADVFASAANYLRTNGWKADERWGRRVSIPKNFDESLTGLGVKKPLASWQSLGVRLPDGAPIPVVRGMEASIVAPDGVNGPVFLAYDNYRVIMSWNRSTYFATSVGLLADAIAQ